MSKRNEAAARPSGATLESERGAVSNFIRSRIDDDLARQVYARRHWSGTPGPAAQQLAGATDPARIRTRFPPEPNGYLHIGHAKSICLNFGLADDYGGRCHLRFDDTNPVKEDQEYVDSIIDSVKWLGFDAERHQYYASDYFEIMYACAQHLIRGGHAYVDSQDAEAMRLGRGTLTEPGAASPYRNRGVAENLDLFTRMRAGEFADGAHVLRAKIDMASPNINLRDPTLYRIRRAEHHRTGNNWVIYPMYDYAHPISDALENITHSICTLEFEDHRPFYDWLLERLSEPLAGAPAPLAKPLPQQIEFARLNLTYVVTSKRKLAQLVSDGFASGWDDPRLPTLVGLRRRGYTASAIRLFCERIGVAKADSWIDYAVLEQALRDDLEPHVPRYMGVITPVKLIIDNFDPARSEPCTAPLHPQRPELGQREFAFSRELWIDAEDAMPAPVPGYNRLYPGNRVRLRYGYVVECTRVQTDSAGVITAVHANYFEDSKSGSPGSANYNVKGVITWIGASDAVRVELRLYERLFNEASPDAGGRDPLTVLNHASDRTCEGLIEPGAALLPPGSSIQIERHGYFISDARDHRPGRPVFNRSVGLKDSWQKK